MLPLVIQSLFSGDIYMLLPLSPPNNLILTKCGILLKWNYFLKKCSIKYQTRIYFNFLTISIDHIYLHAPFH